MDDITTTLLSYSPSTLFFAVIVLSYLFEDVAIITVSVAASQSVITVPMALLAIFIGIFTGDIGLYGLGVWARKWRRLRGFLLTKPSVRVIRRKLRVHPFLNLFLIRFVPGLRFIGFCLSGFFGVRLCPFLMAVFVATVLWTAIVFTLVYQLGEMEWINHKMTWELVPLVLLVLVVINRIAGSKLKKKAA